MMSKFFKNSSENIKTVEGMFANCYNFSANIDSLFEGMTNLSNTSYTFAHTGVSLSSDNDTSNELENLFSPLTKLSTTKGMFLDCSNVHNDVSYKLFENVTNTIKDTSYMFAGTNVSHVDHGVVSKSESYVRFYVKNGTVNVSYSESDAYNTVVELFGNSGGYVIKTDNYYWTNIKTNNSLKVSENVDDACIFSIEDDVDSDNKYIRYDTQEEDVTKIYYINIYSDVKGIYLTTVSNKSKATLFNCSDNIVNTKATRYELEGHGLFKDCLLLENTSYMFAGCQSLEGQIPPDIFYSLDSTSNYNSLKDISHMFDTCQNMYKDNYGTYDLSSNIYSADSDVSVYFIPSNWAIRCPNITSLDGIFKHVGLLENTDGTSKDSLNFSMSTFSNCSKIKTASRMFFGNTLLQGASFNNLFLSNSLNSLKSVERILSFAKVNAISGQSVNTVMFLGYNGSTNRVLTDINHAFYGLKLNNPSYIISPSKIPNAVISNMYVAGNIDGSMISNPAPEKTLLGVGKNDNTSIPNSYYFDANTVNIPEYTPKKIQVNV